MSQLDTTREPTKEERKIIEQYASVGLKDRLVASKLEIPAEMMRKNRHFKRLYDRVIAEAIYEKMNLLSENIKANNTARTANTILRILDLWRDHFKSNNLSVLLEGTYVERLNKLDKALANQDITIGEYSNLYFSQGERFKNNEAMESHEQLKELVDRLTDEHTILKAEITTLESKNKTLKQQLKNGGVKK